MFGNMRQEIRIGLYWGSWDDTDVLGTSNVTLRYSSTHRLFPSARLCDNAGLQHLTVLRCLAVYCPNFCVYHIRLLVSILEKLPSPTLKRLHSELPILPASRRIEEWHRIGEVLQQKRFSYLAFLLRETSSGEQYRRMGKQIREGLSMLEERGILYVEELQPRCKPGLEYSCQRSIMWYIQCQENSIR
jgi:hypothetical protein